MKILHIIPSLSPVRGGPSQAILEMVQAQRQQGIDGGSRFQPLTWSTSTRFSTIPLRWVWRLLGSVEFPLPHGVQVPTPIADARAQLRSQLSIPEDHQVLVFLSRLHPKKGLEQLIDALTALPPEKLTLVIAGSGEAAYEAQITQRIQQQNLTHHVRQIGFVTGDWKALLLQGADLFVLPSYSENLGIAVLEAMAAGLPVVTTPEVAIAPLIQDHETGLVTGADPSSLAAAIQHYRHHPEQACRDGQRGRALVASQFSWPTQATKLIQQYTRLTQKSPREAFRPGVAEPSRALF